MNTSSLQTTQKGEQARNALITAAINQFGEYGAHATTRDIARQAGQNIAAINYYFGSKTGLYLAAAQWIADFIWQQFTPLAVQAEQLLNHPATTAEQLFAQIRESVVHLSVLMTTEETIHLSRFISREQLSPTAAYNLMHQQFIGPMHQLLTALIARYTGRDAQDVQTILHTHALLGEVLFFRMSRETILKCTGWQQFDAEKSQQIAEIVNQHVAFILQGLRAQQGA